MELEMLAKNMKHISRGKCLTCDVPLEENQVEEFPQSDVYGF